MSASFETTRGSPSSGIGGSSGWIARYTPAAAATGTTARKKYARFSRSAAASISLYASSAAWKPAAVYASTIRPGIPATIVLSSVARVASSIAAKRAAARSRVAASYSASAPGRRSRCSSNAIKSVRSKASAREPSAHFCASSVRVQSSTGMKLYATRVMPHAPRLRTVWHQFSM